MNILKLLKNYSVKTINIHIKNHDKTCINTLVQKIYVINLKEDLYKRNYIYMLMKKYQISFTFVVVDRIFKHDFDKYKNHCRISKEELGCCLSHLWCLNDIIKNKYDNSLIFEDDIILHKDFNNKLLSILKNNHKFDFLLLGAHDFNFAKHNYERINNDKMYYHPYENSEQLYGAHANYYSLRGATRMFNIRISELSYFDKEYMLMFNFFKNTAAICYPNLAVTNITTSALNHQRNPLSFLENEYYQKCFINFDFAQYNFIYINMLKKSIIKEHNKFEKYIEACLYDILNDFDKINILKNRIVMDFFTLKDIIFIFSDKYSFKEILPQIVSPKNELENNPC